MDRRLLFVIATCAIVFMIGAIFIYRAIDQPHAVEGKASMLSKAHALIKEGDLEGALKKLNSLVVNYLDSPQAEAALYLMGYLYEKDEELVKARDAFKTIIDNFPSSRDILKANEALENINIKLLFSSVPTADSFVYEVRKGDTLSKIAKNFGTTIELIAKANNLKETSIRIGKRLKLTRSRFSIVVDKSQNILTLKADGNVLKTYKVSCGLNNSTPTGNFKIITKVVNPTWYSAKAVVPPGSPDNILGSRWMGLSEPGYGIHGTTDPLSIGKSVTAGCIRMKNSDVEELYAIVPEGTEALIVD